MLPSIEHSVIVYENSYQLYQAAICLPRYLLKTVIPGVSHMEK